MVPTILAHSTRLRHLAVLTAAAATGAAVCLCAAFTRLLWLLAPDGVLVLAAGVLLPALLSAFWACRQSAHRLRRLRLEDRFLLQHPGADLLIRCLEREDHLWHRSGLRHALGDIARARFPLLLTIAERRRRLAAHLTPALRTLRPRVVPAGGLLVAAAATAILLAEALAARPLTDAPATLAFAGLAAAFAGLYLAALIAARRTFERYVVALADWMHDQGFDQHSPLDRRSYAHTLLYLSAPWLARPARLAA